MNYTEYNNQLKLPDDLYKKTLAGVKSEISKHNQIQRKKKVAYLSFAACFMILVTSISTVKYLNNNSSDTFETTHNSSTNNKGFSTDNRTIKIKIENTKPHIEVFKYDKVTGNPLKGAHLQLLDDKGKLVEEWDTTDEVKVITNLKTGVTYTIKETKVPNNYKVESEKITFKLSADETSRVISIANIPVVPVKNTAASTSVIIIVAGAVLMIGGVGALIFLKKKEG